MPLQADCLCESSSRRLAGSLPPGTGAGQREKHRPIFRNSQR